MMFAAPDSGEAPERTGPLRLSNLLLDLTALSGLLVEQVEAHTWLDSFLLAAGMNQIVEDYLHRDFLSTALISARVAQLPGPLGSLSAGGVRGAAAVERDIRAFRTGDRRARAWQSVLAALVERLACQVMSQEMSGPTDSCGDGDVPCLVSTLTTQLPALPLALRRSVARLPTCFRNLDQRPDDCRRIGQMFAERWSERARPVLVIGARTSGSYLAPLYAAVLRQEGYRDVAQMTFRPAHPPLASERVFLRNQIRAGTLILIADDPPSSGNTVAVIAAEMERLGASRDSMILLLPLLGAMPAPLLPLQCVVLPSHDWTIQELLRPASVEARLNELLPGRTVRAPSVDGEIGVFVQRVRGVKQTELPSIRDPLAAVPGRCHLRRLFRVELIDGRTGVSVELHVYVKGVGLGYFGRHALAVSDALGSFLPDVYGLQDGLLYRQWLPENWRLQPAEITPEFTERAAQYVVCRSRALAVSEDFSRRMGGRQPLWEQAGDMFGHLFGRMRLVIRPILQEAARSLLQVHRPAIIDGSMALSHWFACTGEGEDVDFRKVNYDERAFFNLDRASYEPVFDLATAAADGEMVEGEAATFASGLRRRYEEMTGQAVSAEAWLLYQLMYLAFYEKGLVELLPYSDRQQRAELWQERESALRAMARPYRRYFEERFFADLPLAAQGAFCAIDVDGVLEIERFGFPGIAGPGASTLRALTCHGFRPVLVTGRSVQEVRERCAAYHLAGGVAEYGAAIYDHASGGVTELLSSQDRDCLDRLRGKVAAVDGVHVDPSYHLAVRAYRRDQRGQRRGLRRATIEDLLRHGDLKETMRPIQGNAQTDFMVEGIDKRRGLEALIRTLDPAYQATAKPLALAVGDSVSDLGMFELARLALAPANADPEVRAADIVRVRSAYDRGLKQAAARLLGHAPGTCSVCRPPHSSTDSDLFLSILGASGLGKWSRAAQAARIAWTMQRGSPSSPR